VTILVISHNLTIFQTESQNFQIKSQTVSQCFQSNLCISNRIVKMVFAHHWLPVCKPMFTKFLKNIGHPVCFKMLFPSVYRSFHSTDNRTSVEWNDLSHFNAVKPTEIYSLWAP